MAQKVKRNTDAEVDHCRLDKHDSVEYTRTAAVASDTPPQAVRYLVVYFHTAVLLLRVPSWLPVQQHHTIRELDTLLYRTITSQQQLTAASSSRSAVGLLQLFAECLG